MTRIHHPKWPFILALFLPVAVAALIAGGLNLASFLELQEDHRIAHAQQAQDDKDVKATRDFNRQVAGI